MLANPLGRLFLVPFPLGPDSDPRETLPPSTIAVAARLRHFVAENARTARRFLSRLPLEHPIQEIRFAELNEHTRPETLPDLLTPLLAGDDVGLVSEAGCPAIADPGSALIALAHARGITVVPLIGPNAILLALMASGLNGQAFAFHGYLPVDSARRASVIRELESVSATSGATQLFIETPYRGDAMLAALLATAQPSTHLTVAADLTLASETVATFTLAEWAGMPRLSLASRPAVFALLAPRVATARASRIVRRS